jgi:IclR family transcriptional regulator, acetate operon repressor
VSEPSNAAPPNYPIGSVDSALQLLKIFSAQKAVRIADASREIGVARSTAHRMVQQLQYRGFVSQDPETRMYVAGPELVRMALSVVRQLDLRTIAMPVMQRLEHSLGETVHVAELRGSDIFFLHSVESARSVRVGARTGMTMPAHGTAVGKVLLADLDPDQLRVALPTARLKALTPRTLTSRKDLEKELATVRERGYATNFGESESDVHSIAVPIRDSSGRVRAGLAIAAPPARLTEEMVSDVAKELSVGASEIGESLPV